MPGDGGDSVESPIYSAERSRKSFIFSKDSTASFWFACGSKDLDLFVAQGFHGVDGGGATGWDETGEGGCGDEDERYAGEDPRVAGAFHDPAGRDFVEGHAQEEAGEQAGADVDGGGGKDDAEDVRASCPESHADSEFVGACGDTVGDHAVKPHCGKHQSKNRKESEESGD